MCEREGPKLGEILDAVSHLCYDLISCGAEISRVEDTARRICAAYSIEEADIFALSSTIIITLTKDGKTLTQTRRVKEVSTNLDRIKQLNALSREICSTLPGYEYIIERLAAAEGSPVYPKAVSVFAYALISGAFAVFFGGGIQECIVAAAVGTAVRLFMLLLEWFYVMPVIVTAAASSAAAAGVNAAALCLGSLNVNTVIISILMNLVPGVALVNSIRDFAARDYSSGSARVFEALFTAAAIAVGTAVSLLWQ